MARTPSPGRITKCRRSSSTTRPTTFADLDRFSRVQDQVWASYGSISGGNSRPVPLDGYGYGYDRAGNRTSVGNQTNSALSETYGYDNLDRLASSTRATTLTTETWTLDSLGNFTNSTDTGTNQNRGVDPANEIQTISGGAATPAYDAAGNMTTTTRARRRRARRELCL